jgi:ABC transporter substrate binding protein
MSRACAAPREYATFLSGEPDFATARGEDLLIMRRREFIAGLGGAAVWPLAARAQQPPVPVLGFVSGRSPKDSAANVAAFRKGLAETGYMEGQNVAVQYRWAEGRYDQQPALIADLIRHPVAVLAVFNIASALAAKQVSATLPIVFAASGDPVKLGLVTSFNRPGGNLTGVSFLNTVLVAKQFEALHEFVRAPALLALLVTGSYAAEKCPGLRVIEDNIRASADAAGVTDDVIYTPEWKFWERRGQTNARIGYKKNPAGWCESMWHFLGPDHPPMIKHALLRRD